MQLLPFTCGPAALIRLLRDAGFDTPNSLEEQIAVWRTANIVHVSDEPAGCSGAGLALAAHDRGVRLGVYLARPEFDFTDTVRSAVKRELIGAVVAEQRAELRRRGLPLGHFDLDDPAFRARLDAASRFLVLVRQTYLSRLRDYHWIYARRDGPDRVLVYDPYLEVYAHTKHEPEMVGDSFALSFEALLRLSHFNRRRDRCWVF